MFTLQEALLNGYLLASLLAGSAENGVVPPRHSWCTFMGQCEETCAALAHAVLILWIKQERQSQTFHQP